MLTFLELNGFAVNATEREFADWIISFSSGADPGSVADTLRKRL
jgi:prophage maintenance system killer protein